MSTKIVCQDCGGLNTMSRGKKRRRYYCYDCEEYKTLREEVKDFEYSEDKQTGTAHIITSIPRIMSDADLLAYLKIDPDRWSIDKVVYGKSEGYRKDRRVKWVVKDGKVVDGEVDDSGKLLIEPMFSVKVFLSRKTSQIQDTLVLEDLIADAKKYSPKSTRTYTPTGKKGFLLEIAMPDLHFGKLTWREETGSDYDIHITEELVHRTFDQLLSYSTGAPIEKVLFPIGNDFFNVDTKDNTTAHGTPQQEDTRWQKTFKAGRILIVELVEKLCSIAPVDVLVIPGNHDETRSFFLGDALECWYHNNKYINVNNSAMKRKYYSFGNGLVGLTHGYYERYEKLPSLMALEQPQLWAASKHREWHIGDKHHKKDLVYKTDEFDGVVIRQLRSLTPPDSWHFDKGFVGAERAVESLLWHPEKGVIAQYTSVI